MFRTMKLRSPVMKSKPNVIVIDVLTILWTCVYICAWLRVAWALLPAPQPEQTIQGFLQHRSPYTILNVHNTATAKDIRSSYKRLAVKMHPDKRAWSEQAMEEFLLLQEAYEILYDPVQRCDYDLYSLHNTALWMRPRKWWNRFEQCVVIKEEARKIDPEITEVEKLHQVEVRYYQGATPTTHNVEQPQSALQVYVPKIVQLYLLKGMNELSCVAKTTREVLSVRAGNVAAWVSKVLGALWPRIFSRQ